MDGMAWSTGDHVSSMNLLIKLNVQLKLQGMRTQLGSQVQADLI